MNKEELDLWANDYDETVLRLSHQYPFDGYYESLNAIYEKVMKENTDSCKILDVGFGTGLLTEKFYKQDFEIYGIDFSSKMVEIAQSKMPNAHFIPFDFHDGLPEEFVDITFDVIVSTYAFHHLFDFEKIQYIETLYQNLKKNGTMYILDISFLTQADMEACEEKYSEDWDYSEVYTTKEFLIPELERLGMRSTYTQMSSCAGLLEIRK